MTPIEILKDRGFMVYTDLPYLLSNGIEYYVGESNSRVGIVALIDEQEGSIYMLYKEDLREMAKQAKNSGYKIEEFILYTNYGLELHSKYESPETVGLTQIVKITKEGYNQTCLIAKN